MKKRGSVLSDSPDRLNVIVKGTKMVGDLVTESNLRIDGEVKGNVNALAKVVIGPSGSINGNLTCTDADIEGKVEGILKVENLLSLRATANVNGEISTAKIQIDEGAEFSGNCTMDNKQKAVVPKEMNQEHHEDIVY